MANKNLFKSIVGKLSPRTDAVNHEAAPAYAFSPQHALAQYAATGSMNATFYASAESQLADVLALCDQVEPEFIARTALYCRQTGRMKDLPALLCAVLSVKSPGLLAEVFDRVIDTPKMLRNFVQVMRSGVTGRKSLGTLPKRLVLQWIEAHDDDALFRASVGNDPSLADIVKMVHPKPATKAREALLGYLIGRPHDAGALPALVREYEAFKNAGATDGPRELPQVPWEMLTALPLSSADWIGIAANAPWQMTRMNLNTFLRHGVFEDAKVTELIARRLRDPQAIAHSGVLPYQLMVAHRCADAKTPAVVLEALQDAMETAVQNVPAIDGQVYVFPDVSSSMQSPVTGFRKGATSAVRCIDVAALIAAAVVRKNPRARVIPFDTKVIDLTLNGRDSIMTNAKILASVGGGGTNCSAPLALLNKEKARGDLVIYASDNQSWVDAGAAQGGRGTATMQEWTAFRVRNPAARLVCIDLQPYGTTQARDRQDVFNVGGFSDQVFELIAHVAAGQLDGRHWVDVIQAVRL